MLHEFLHTDVFYGLLIMGFLLDAFIHFTCNNQKYRPHSSPTKYTQTRGCLEDRVRFECGSWTATSAHTHTHIVSRLVYSVIADWSDEDKSTFHSVY